ncbi:urease accessory protein UreJ [Roseateles aquatilis]|uniref:Urease accessory protein UreJ n=1 Tax=Roseateles aquatilis TaxID=431061 RepID=A0A246J4R1_9BURK|nr:HupE/UreJ family protein [Roseateles aquatilis]OWQ87578.1 urease accessory protein UreJ [Roseateles aquatilis]
MTHPRSLLAMPAAALALLLPALALAHAGDGGVHEHGLAAGFTHPFTGLDHLAAMLAVGLWSALTQTGRRMLAAPFAFAGLLLIGALLGAAGLSLPGVEPMVAASVLVLGLVAAARWHLGAAASALLVGAFAVFHGLAHGSELQGVPALLGMVVATALLHALGLGVGLRLRALAPAWSRAAGGAIALLGLGLLGRMVIA